jgi:glutamine amidotransferase PdxT
MITLHLQAYIIVFKNIEFHSFKDKVKILATLQVGKSDYVPVALQQNNRMVTSFHPELTRDLRFHMHFINMAMALNSCRD